MDLTRREVLAAAIAAGLLPAGVAAQPAPTASLRNGSGGAGGRVDLGAGSIAFSSAPAGPIRSALQAAYDSALALIDEADLDQLCTEPSETIKGAIVLDVPDWLQVGHLPVNGTALSNHVPFRLDIACSGGAVVGMSMTLFFLNLHIWMGSEDSEFTPAEFDASNHLFTPLEGDWGLSLVADNPGNLPAETVVDNADTPPSFKTFTSATNARIDLKLSWDAAPHQPLNEGRFEIIVPPAGGDIHLRFHSAKGGSTTTTAAGSPFPEINAIVHQSERLAVLFESRNVLSVIDSGSNAAALQALRQEFEVPADFKGISLGKVQSYWLEDDGTIGEETITASIVGAVSLASTSGKNSASWYLSGFVDFPSTGDPYILMNVFAPDKLSIAVAAGALSRASITGRLRIDSAEHPILGFLEPLDGRDVSLNIVNRGLQPSAASWDVELAVRAAPNEVLARIRPGSGPNEVSPLLLDSAVLGVSFAAAISSIDNASVSQAGRTDFLSLGGAAFAGALGAAPIEAFAPDAFNTHELRIVGIYLRSQSGSINGVSTKRETALLFDFEADYEIDLNQISSLAGLKTNRPITTKVDKFGFSLGNWLSGIPFVQGLGSLFSFSIGDAGFWDISGLAGLLKLTGISIKGPKLKFDLGLSLDLGVISASGFGISFDLKDALSPLLHLPSLISVDIAGVLKGKGRLLIEDNDKMSGEKVIGGALDLTLVPIDLRVAAAAKVSKVPKPGGEPVTAFVASLLVEFPVMIPILNTGIGLKGIEGLYAQHFERAERTNVSWPTLDWFERAKGNVAGSIVPLDTSVPTDLWDERYGAWAIGLGARFGLLANPQLINLNAMVLFELPGPRLTIFAKVNVLEELQENSEVDLSSGILGILQFDGAKNQLTLAASAQMKLAAGLIDARAVLGLVLSAGRLSEWQFSFGKFPVGERVVARLHFLGLNIRVELYFMAAGDGLEIGSTRYPGFAIALGFLASVKIGGSSVFLQGRASIDLVLSFDKSLFAKVDLAASGELRLWFVSIGAGARAAFYYQQGEGITTEVITASGEVRISRFFKIRGSVRYSPSTSPPQPDPPHLVTAVSFEWPDMSHMIPVGGDTDGVGIGGPVDGPTLPTPLLIGNSGSAEQVIPVTIDAVIVLTMRGPPLVGPAAATLLDQAPGSSAFRYFSDGSRDYSHSLTSIALIEDGGTSVFAAWPADAGPVGAWREVKQTAESDREPTSVYLALLSRNPVLGGSASLAPPFDVAFACAELVPPREALYVFSSTDIGDGGSGTWTLPGAYCGGSDAFIPAVDVEAVFEGDTEHALPAHAFCAPLGPPEDGLVALTFASAWVYIEDFILRSVSVRIRGDFSSMKDVVLLVGHIENSPVAVEARSRDGSTVLPIGVQEHYLQSALGDHWFDSCPDIRALAERLVSIPGGEWIFKALRVQPDFSSSALPFDIILRGPADRDQQSESMAGESRVLFIGTFFIPNAELQRFASEEASQKTRIAQIEAFLASGDKAGLPLLKPNTPYRLELGTDQGTQTISFRTVENPPPGLSRYLLASFPNPNYGFHYPNDKVGLLFESRHIFDVLAAFGAEVRITVTDHLDRDIANADGTVAWHRGVQFLPLDLLAQTRLADDAAPPSPSEEAILDALADAPAGCIALPDSQAKARWLFFDIILEPMSQYRLKIEVRRPDGSWYVFHDWSFGTGFYADGDTHAEALDSAPRRRRLMLSDGGLDGLPALARSPDSDGPVLDGFDLIPEKDLEDAILAMTGERPARVERPRMTRIESVSNGRRALEWILVESDEPMFRLVDLSLTGVGRRSFAYSRASLVSSATRGLISSSGYTALVASSVGINPIQIVSSPVDEAASPVGGGGGL